jgi:folate-binding protein YgfZ
MIPEGYEALTTGAAWIDFSARGRLCLVGADRKTFLHGQVTNNVKDLHVGQGCYAALANAKGKMTCDLYIFILQDEILLDFEPGLKEKVIERLEKYIIADDVQIVDASEGFKMISVLGPKSEIDSQSPKPFEIKEDNGTYIANTLRLGLPDLDFFVPKDKALDLQFPKASMEAFETVRIERGIPRFGVDMDENTLVPEAIPEAISYTKGCYIGQEVIARIRTYGQVAKALRSLRFEAGAAIPKAGDKILHDGKEVGWITSAVFSPKYQQPVALGYVRKECNQIGGRVNVGEAVAEIYDPAAGAQ